MIYRKSGATIRWENGSLVSTVEKGIAIDHGDRFECRPDEGPRPAPLEPGVVRNVAEDVTRRAGAVHVERLIVTEGTAEHECGENRWSERFQRLHLSLVQHRDRLLLELGSFDTEEVDEVVEAFARFTGTTRSAGQLRLAPRVTAALIPHFIGAMPLNARLWQSGGGLDGTGRPIVEVALDAPPWPNWYRPSYRRRPVRLPLNVRVEAAHQQVDDSLPRAVATLGLPTGTRDVRLLVVDEREVYATVIDVTRVRAVAHTQRWYPYGAGSFGAEMML